MGAVDHVLEELDNRIEELESDRRFYVDACIYMAIWIMRQSHGRLSSDEVLKAVKKNVPEMQKQRRVQEYFKKEKS